MQTKNILNDIANLQNLINVNLPPKLLNKITIQNKFLKIKAVFDGELIELKNQKT